MIWSAAARWITLVKVCCVLALFFITASQTMGQGIRLLGTEDTAIAFDLDAVIVPAMNNGRYPGGESPPLAIDGLVGTKYLNFGDAGSGFIVTPGLAGIPVDGFQITTANDAPGRDPAMWSLYGFDGALTTTDSGPDPAINADGLAEAWTLISSGSVSLPGDPDIGGDQRGAVGPMVAVNSVTPYAHYKFIVDAIKRPSDGIMQFAEIQFFADDTDPSSGFLLTTDPMIAVDEIPTPAGFSGSSYPGGESPARGIDQDSGTKYLNFGQERSGIIVTNSGGPVRADFMRLTTANDAVERDPTSYELYGTNDPIQSVDNSDSMGGEVWTLISSGPLSLPDARFDDSTVVAINAGADYTSYRLVFPTVKDAGAANSMQIADIQLYTIPEPATFALLALGGLAMAAATRRCRA